MYNMCSRMVGGVSRSTANITTMARMLDMKTSSARYAPGVNIWNFAMGSAYEVSQN
jgi:hypothetical protein